MKTTLAILLLVTSLAASTTNPPLVPPSHLQTPRLQRVKPRKPGRWFMAEDGHAVYCYGPVITINIFLGEPKRAATQCRGNSAVVPLRD